MASRSRVLAVDDNRRMVVLFSLVVASVLIGVSMAFVVAPTSGISSFQALSVGVSGAVVLVGTLLELRR